MSANGLSCRFAGELAYTATPAAPAINTSPAAVNVTSKAVTKGKRRCCATTSSMPELDPSARRLAPPCGLSPSTPGWKTTRRLRVDAETGRLADLGAVLVGVLNTEGLDHYAVAMKDPEGNEFDIN
jgi:hypothetical protein